MGFLPMLSKELKELFSSLKIIYIPIIFTLLTIMQPITMKMLPTLLKNSSNMPPGTIIQIPEPTAADVMGSLLQQFGQLGGIVIILIVMGAIAGERASGVMAMVFSKPVRYRSYFFAKAIANSILVVLSIYMAMIVSTYYTEILFGDVNWAHAMLGTLLYVPNLLMIVSLTLCGSALLKSSVGAGGASFVVYLLLSIVPQYIGQFGNSISPNQLIDSAGKIVSGSSGVDWAKPLASVLAICVIFLLIGLYSLKKREI